MATTSRKPRTTATTTNTTIPASAAKNTMLCAHNQSLCHTTPKPKTTSKTTAATHTHTHLRAHIRESTYTHEPRQPETKECSHTLTNTHAQRHLHPGIDPCNPPPPPHTSRHTNTLNERNQERTNHLHFRTCAWAQLHTHASMHTHTHTHNSTTYLQRSSSLPPPSCM